MVDGRKMAGAMNNRTVRLAAAALLALLALCGVLAQPAQAARIKDLAQIDGVRDNQLLGFGLIGGLAGTGDDPKSAPFTAEAIANMLGSFGLQLDPALVKVKNFAAVMVSADLPAYVNQGDRLDISVSSIGTAKSLEGGVLYQTLLKGVDGEVYAVAQGTLSLGSVMGGEGASGGGRGKKVTTVGRIPGGALVENSVPSTILKSDGGIRLNLTHPDFTTANAIASAVNDALGSEMARAEDAGCVSVSVPLKYMANMVPFIALIENLDAEPGRLAKVVINQRTGTVVIGQDVQVLPVAVTHGTMTLTFGERIIAPAEETEPAPEAGGGGLEALSLPATSETATAPSGVTSAEVLGPETGLLLKPTTAEQVAVGLNKMNLTPQDVVAIFEAIDAAGALLGELEII